MENPSFLITYIFQGYHIINATCLAEVFLVTEVWMCDWFIFPIIAANCALLIPLALPYWVVLQFRYFSALLAIEKYSTVSTASSLQFTTPAPLT